MPTEYRVSGPQIMRDGKPVEPKAAIHICEGCRYEGAAFGLMRGDAALSYCGWKHAVPVCVGLGTGARSG